MTIRTRCPSCGTEYYLAEQQAGKQVRCKQCAETIQVPDDKLPEVTSAEVPEKKRTREELPDKPTAAPSAKASAGTSVRKKAGSSSGWGTPLLILTIVGLVIGLPVLACGTAGYFIYRGIKNAAHKFEETWSPHEPADLDEALAYVTSTNQAKEQSGCKWLAKNSIDDDDHARVSKSLDPLLANQNIETRVEAARALKKCATKDNVTSLIAALETTDNFWYGNEAAETRRLAMEMLADLKDERAIAPIAKRLPDPKDRPHASRALISFGARSAPELKRMLEHNDTAVRDEVRSILKAVVPDENNDVLFALGDLRSNDVNRRAAGARALAQVKLDPKYQGEVSKALDARILDGDQNVRLEAANALRVWATGENVSALIQSLALCQDDFFQQRNPETRKIVIEVLGKLGDAKAIPALAERLSNASDRALAGNALIQFGAKAAPDVDKYLTHADAAVRTEARRILREIKPNSDADVKLALADIASGDNERRKQGAQSLATMALDAKSQQEVSKALDPLAIDPDMIVRLNSVKALRVWATRDNVPTLIRTVSSTDQPFDPKSGEARRTAIEVLGKLHDERAIAVLAERLADAADRSAAGKALVAIGGGRVAIELGKYVDHPDAAVRDEARKLLKELAPGEKPDLDVVLKDLKSGETAKRKAAAEKLTGILPVEDRRKDTAAALEPLITDDDESTRLAALGALAGWATTDNVPALLKAIDTGSDKTRAAAMEVVTQFKQDDVAAALVKRLMDEKDRDNARKALIRIGAVAEKLVLALLDSPDAPIRKEGCRILHSVGTHAVSFEKLRKLTFEEKDEEVKKEARAAMFEVLKRK